ncbi:MAG: hypothetical protein EOO40_07505 [Deltaproteobacteria bacterium]|nr:MAG: hypothetical protein EOO40_07505 [Deltaproteobacteria bacterium]
MTTGTEFLAAPFERYRDQSQLKMASRQGHANRTALLERFGQQGTQLQEFYRIADSNLTALTQLQEVRLKGCANLHLAQLPENMRHVATMP